MTIEGVPPHGLPLALDEPALRSTVPAPLTPSGTWQGAVPARPDGVSRVPLVLRGTMCRCCASERCRTCPLLRA